MHWRFGKTSVYKTKGRSLKRIRVHKRTHTHIKLKLLTHLYTQRIYMLFNSQINTIKANFKYNILRLCVYGFSSSSSSIPIPGIER